MKRHLNGQCPFSTLGRKMVGYEGLESYNCSMDERMCG